MSSDVAIADRLQTMAQDTGLTCSFDSLTAVPNLCDTVIVFTFFSVVKCCELFRLYCTITTHAHPFNGPL